MHGDWLRLSARILLAAAEPEVCGPCILVLQVFLSMALPAGRSVVFVTGNAKKLEEVRIKNVIPVKGRTLMFGLSRMNSFRWDTC